VITRLMAQPPFPPIRLEQAAAQDAKQWVTLELPKQVGYVVCRKGQIGIEPDYEFIVMQSSGVRNCINTDSPPGFRGPRVVRRRGTIQSCWRAACSIISAVRSLEASLTII
jgi:hypothetical protein